MTWFRIISAMGIMSLAFAAVDAPAQTGKGKGNQGGGTGTGTGGGTTGGGTSGGGKTTGGGGGLGNQGNKGQGNQGGGLGNKGQGNQGGGLGNQGSGGGSRGNSGNSGGSTLGNQGNRGNQGSSSNSGLGNKGQGLGNQGQSQGRGNDRGRLGNTNYGSTNNRNDRFDIREAPINLLNKGSIASQVLRTEQVRVNTNIRQGYHSYHNNWRDDYFYYPHYSFTPYGNNCSFSPWYYYPHLPGYVSVTRIFYVGNLSWTFTSGTNYSWNRNRNTSGWGYDNDRYDRYDRNVLDDSLWDLVNAFERGDRRALGRLIPRRGRINIYMDDRYAYSLEADDFYDMMLDNIETTRTVRYEIDRVQTYRDEAQVTARHEYVDPWGRRASVYHNFRLEEDRYGYTITDFRTSWRR